MQFEEYRGEAVAFHRSRVLDVTEGRTRAGKDERGLLGHVQFRSWGRRCVETGGVELGVSTETCGMDQRYRQAPDDGQDMKVPEVFLHNYPHLEVKDRKSGDMEARSCRSRVAMNQQS